MEIEILLDDKTELKFKIKGETHTIANMLKDELLMDSSVKFAGYNIEHPLKNEAIFDIKTNRKEAKKVLKEAIERLKKKIDTFEDEIEQIK